MSTSRAAAKQETRQALVEAAMAEFADKGLDAPSLDVICARAGFTRGAFYVHFRDREELLAAVMEHALGLLLDAVIADEGDRDDLSRSVERYVEIASRGVPDLGRGAPEPAPEALTGIPLHQVMAACQRHEGTRERMVGVLQEAQRRVAEAARSGQRAGRVRADVGADGVASLLVLLALGVRAAADLRLPLHVARTRDALLHLLATGEGGEGEADETGRG